MSKRKSKFYQAEAVENNVVSINTYYNNTKKRQVHLLPKTLNQETYINLLTDPAKIIVLLADVVVSTCVRVYCGFGNGEG